MIAASVLDPRLKRGSLIGAALLGVLRRQAPEVEARAMAVRAADVLMQVSTGQLPKPDCEYEFVVDGEDSGVIWRPAESRLVLDLPDGRLVDLSALAKRVDAALVEGRPLEMPAFLVALAETARLAEGRAG